MFIFHSILLLIRDCTVPLPPTNHTDNHYNVLHTNMSNINNDKQSVKNEQITLNQKYGSGVSIEWMIHSQEE